MADSLRRYITEEIKKMKDRLLEKQLFLTKWTAERIVDVRELGRGRWIIITNWRVVLIEEED